LIFPGVSETLPSFEVSGIIYASTLPDIPGYLCLHLFRRNFVLLTTGRHMSQTMLGPITFIKALM